MRDFKALAEEAIEKHRDVVGLIDVVVEGTPPVGLRYQCENDIAAYKIMCMREFELSEEYGNRNTLRMDDSDVIELWGS